MSPTKENRLLVSGALQNVVSTHADTETSVIRLEERIGQARRRCTDNASVLRGEEMGALRRDAWQHMIDRKLIEWGRDPERLEDEGIDPPSGETILAAIRLAEVYRDQERPAPDSVVLDPNGGIVFERRERDISEVIHIWEDGTAEYLVFRGTRLLERQTLGNILPEHFVALRDSRGGRERSDSGR